MHVSDETANYCGFFYLVAKLPLGFLVPDAALQFTLVMPSLSCKVVNLMICVLLLLLILTLLQFLTVELCLMLLALNRTLPVATFFARLITYG